MEKKFKALRIVATIYRVAAWIVLVLGVLFAFAVVIMGLLFSDAVRPDLSGVPLISGVTGVLTGISTGLGVLIGALLQFVFLYAANEVIQLGLAIEKNTRQTAYYLQGEGELAPLPQPDSWQAPAPPEEDEDAAPA